MGSFDYDAFKTYLNSHAQVSWGLDAEKRRKRTFSVILWLNELFDGDDTRRLFLKWAFDCDSSKDLTDTQLAGLWDWLKPSKDDDTGKWVIRPKCYETSAAWMIYYQKQIGQLDMFEVEA